jgi:hypothetical protein
MSRIATWCAALATASLLAGHAVAQERLQAGILACDISAGIGLIIGSQRTVSCTFTPSSPGPVEFYTGTISKFGLDLGATSGGFMTWAVYAPTTRNIGALAGTYGGLTAEASVGAGFGANALIGGSDRTVTLQPFSAQGQIGFNVAAGVAGLDLRYMR